MGNIETLIDKQRDISVQTVTGKITADEIIQKIEDYYSKGITRSILWDFSKVSLVKITSEDVCKIAHLAKKYSGLRKGGKTALVFVSDLGFGLGRMYDIAQDIEESEVDHMVFRDKNSTMKWLSSTSENND